jgi:GDP-L-fucose synthase
MKKNKKNIKICILGSSGMIGTYLVKKLKKTGFKNLNLPKKKDLNLLHENKTYRYIKKTKPDIVINLAAKNAGAMQIKKNKFEFLYQNTKIFQNLIFSCYKNDINIFLNITSASAYPNKKFKNKEKDILSGKLEKSSEAYGLAKIQGIKLTEYLYSSKYNFFSLVLPNIFGPKPLNKDNYQFIDLFIRKFINEENINIILNKKLKREFLFIEDACDSIIFFLNKALHNKIYNHTINIQPTINIKLIKVIDLISSLTKNKSYTIINDKRIINSSKMLDYNLSKKYSWKPKIKFIDGLKKTIKYFKNYNSKIKKSVI